MQFHAKFDIFRGYRKILRALYIQNYICTDREFEAAPDKHDIICQSWNLKAVGGGDKFFGYLAHLTEYDWATC